MNNEHITLFFSINAQVLNILKNSINTECICITLYDFDTFDIKAPLLFNVCIAINRE